MNFTQPTLHHVLYIESDSLQIAKYGFLRYEPRSIWTTLETEKERADLDAKLSRLHKLGYIKLYIVSACCHGDGNFSEEMHEELDNLDRIPVFSGRA